MLWRSRAITCPPLSTPSPSPLRGSRRLFLRRAAYRYAAHNWPVVPGARLDGGRFDCGQAGCLTVTCHPAHADWETTASVDRARVAAWWRHLDHGVLLATGHSFDVLELASPVGRWISREVRGPVAVAGSRWMFFVQPGGVLGPRLSEYACAVLLGAGSWIPVPPTPIPEGQVRWETDPGRCGWRLPHLDEVERAALDALRFDHQLKRVWRHLNPAAATLE